MKYSQLKNSNTFDISMPSKVKCYICVSCKVLITQLITYLTLKGHQRLHILSPIKISYMSVFHANIDYSMYSF